MPKFVRFVALTTLAAFLGLSALEVFHTHATLQTEANCSVCQIAHQTPALLSAGSTATPHWVSTQAPLQTAPSSYVQFLSVAHGLSPPLV